MRVVSFGTNVTYPALGQGTWRMGVDPNLFMHEVKMLQEGIQHNLRVIDTAAMYADGGAERVVGQAIQPYRHDVFVVTKVWPTHADYEGVMTSLKNSLDRLNTSYVDLFLLHWPSKQYPLQETMRAMATVYEKGWAKSLGVSNFNVDLLKQAQQFLGDIPLVANQVEYSLTARAAELTVIPYCQDHNITVMAYSPIKHLNALDPNGPQRRLLHALARDYHTTEHVIALAWVIRQREVIAIPKTSQHDHLLANLSALTLNLSPDDEKRLDALFPPSSHDLAIQLL